MYLGQVMEIRKLLAEQGVKLVKGVKVQSVDNYQGEENKIVIVSCVRNNTQKKIGNFNYHFFVYCFYLKLFSYILFVY